VSDTPQVSKNEQANRYEVERDGRTAILEYSVEGNRVSFAHTVVPEDMESQGIGSAMARRALDDAREQGLTVLPFCSFVSAFIRRHPEYLDMVPQEKRALFGL